MTFVRSDAAATEGGTGRGTPQRGATARPPGRPVRSVAPRGQAEPVGLDGVYVRRDKRELGRRDYASPMAVEA